MKLLAFVGIPITALFACGTVGIFIYVTITQSSNSVAQQGVADTPAAISEALSPTNTPQAVVALPTAADTPTPQAPTPTSTYIPTFTPLPTHTPWPSPTSTATPTLLPVLFQEIKYSEK